MVYLYSTLFTIGAWLFILLFWGTVIGAMLMWASTTFSRIGESQRKAVADHKRDTGQKQHKVVSATKHLPKSYGRSRIL